MKILLVMSVLFVALGLAACAPKVGSDAWCKMIKEQPKGDLSANQAADFAKHCVFKKLD